MEKLDLKALAAAGGVLGALYALLLGWAAWLLGWGTDLVTAMSSLYLGYRPTFFGGIVGAVWAFVDGAIAGAVIAWVYNGMTGRR